MVEHPMYSRHLVKQENVRLRTGDSKHKSNRDGRRVSGLTKSQVETRQRTRAPRGRRGDRAKTGQRRGRDGVEMGWRWGGYRTRGWLNITKRMACYTELGQCACGVRSDGGGSADQVKNGHVCTTEKGLTSTPARHQSRSSPPHWPTR